MKNILMALCGIAFTPLAFGQSDCSAVKQDKARLACYDKAAKEKSAALAAPAATPTPPAEEKTKAADKPEKPGDKIVFKSQFWHVHQHLDAMTDKKSCTALYKNAWTVQGTADNLYVSLKGRGGVKAYTLRIDEAAPDSMQLASSTEKSISAIILQPSFERIYNAKRVRLQIITILDSFPVEDIDLSGFKEAVDYIRANCSN